MNDWKRDERHPIPQWTDARLLGYQPLDRIHEEFYAVARGLVACTAETACQALAAFEAHAVEHFGQEDEWMRATQFPPRDCHMKEHAAVLKSTREVGEALAAGRGGAELLRDFGEHLLEWFPGHADYLDSALAAWMSKRAYGGKPIVLRRKIQGQGP